MQRDCALSLLSFPFWCMLSGFVAPRSMASGTFVYLGYFNPLLLVLSVNIFVFFKYLSRTSILESVKKSRFGNCISLISTYSFGIYLVHYMVIAILKNNLLIHILNPDHFIWIVLIVLLTLIISLMY